MTYITENIFFFQFIKVTFFDRILKLKRIFKTNSYSVLQAVESYCRHTTLQSWSKPTKKLVSSAYKCTVAYLP